VQPHTARRAGGARRPRCREIAVRAGRARREGIAQEVRECLRTAGSAGSLGERVERAADPQGQPLLRRERQVHLRPRVHRRVLARRVRVQRVDQLLQRLQPHDVKLDLDGDMQQEVADRGVFVEDRARARGRADLAHGQDLPLCCPRQDHNQHFHERARARCVDRQQKSAGKPSALRTG
jgi:hypothetical protein